MAIVLMAVSAWTLQGCGEGNGQNSGNNDPAPAITTITGSLSNCFADSMRIYEILGPTMRKIGAARLNNKEGNYSFDLKINLPHEGFYAIGDDPRRAVTVLLGPPANIELTGNCQNPRGTFRLSNSAQNDEYQALMVRVNSHNQQMQMLMNNLNIFRQTDPAQVPRLETDLNAENSSYFGYLDSLQAKGSIVGKVASIYNFKPFMTDPSHSVYSNDLDYFVQNFMSGMDLNLSLIHI